MKTLKLLVPLFVGAVLMASCEKEFVQNELNDDSKNKRIGNVVINNNRSDLKKYVSLKSELLPLKSIPSKTPRKFAMLPYVDPTDNYTFTLVGEVLPPSVGDIPLQASHVDISGNYAFVTYNVKDYDLDPLPTYKGALMVFDVSDPTFPILISQAIYEDAELNSVFYKDGKLYVVGAMGDFESEGLTSPAFLQVVELDGMMQIINVSPYIQLASYAGTDVFGCTHLYASSGDNGYFYIMDFTPTKLDSIPLDNIRAISENCTDLWVLQGEPARLSRYNHESMSGPYPLPGAAQLNAKTDFDATLDYLYVALNEGGAAVVNFDGTVKQLIDKPVTPPGELDEDYVTNSLSVVGDLVLFANGGEGLVVRYINHALDDSIFDLGIVGFEEYTSANFAEAKDSIIFVADGLGGLKIVKIGVSNGNCPNDHIKPCPTLVENILSLFPEQENNKVKYPQFFAPGAPYGIITTAETDVYLSFLFENAGWKNTLGYFAYPEGAHPADITDVTKITLIQNVSGIGEGGALITGDAFFLGHFPANTVIEFYLIAQGWNGGMVTDGIYTNYTYPPWNDGDSQQHILFHEGQCDDLVLTFEDKNPTLGDSDLDFNDILLTLHDDTKAATANSRIALYPTPVPVKKK